ncbi:MAG: histidine phosphatase family protein [Sphingomonas sp.]
MTLRLTLLCAGATERGGDGFSGADAPLAPGEARRAAMLHAVDGAGAACAPTAAARETAAAMGVNAAVEPRLADIDHGVWAGLSFDQAAARDGAALAAWLAAPQAGAPGGESLAAVVARVTPWLDAASERNGRLLAITHPMVVRAALSAALSLPLAATMRIDLAPLGGVTLSFHRGWRWQALTPRRETNR